MSKSKSEEEMANELGDEFLNYDGVEGGTTVTEVHTATTTTTTTTTSLEIPAQNADLSTEQLLEGTDKGQSSEDKKPPSEEKENPEQSEGIDLGHTNGNAEKEKKEENEEDEKKDGEGEEVFEVEAILDHKRNKSGLKYHIKWKGYSVDDSTWENEGDVYAAELLEEYWTKHKDEQPAPDTSSKRKGAGRKRSAPSSSQFKDTKKPRTSSKPRGSRMRYDDDDDNPQTSESWEDQVIAVETVTRDDKTGDLLVYLKWNNGETSRHPAKDVNMRCPQKMIKFYEQRLTFAPPATHNKS